MDSSADGAVVQCDTSLNLSSDPVLISLNPEIKPENPYAEVSTANGRLSPIGFMLAPPAAVVTEDQDFIELVDHHGCPRFQFCHGLYQPLIQLWGQAGTKNCRKDSMSFLSITMGAQREVERPH